MKILIAALLVTTACMATGPKYTGSTKNDVVIYRTMGMAGALSPYHVQLGDKHCSIGNGGFYVVPLKKKDILAVGWADGSVSDTIEASPGDYIRVSHNVGSAMVSGAGTGFGALGGAVTAQNQGAGDFYLQKMPKNIAENELKSLGQACQ